MKAVEFPEREFANKAELFEALKSNKEHLVSLKKASKNKSASLKFNHFTKKDSTIKSLNMEEGYIYPVINTTKVMDSHNDVHIDGIWNKSVKEQQGKIYYIADHDLSLGKVIAYPKDVEMFTEVLQFSELGSNYEGNTQALIFKVSKDAIKYREAKEVIEEKIDIEHSVRMQYVTLFLCVNSSDDGYKEEKANWDTYFPYVANKDHAEEKGYFWAVTEAKIYKEGSMVLSGSNDVTPLLQKDNEPSNDTHKEEPPKGTQNYNAIFY